MRYTSINILDFAELISENEFENILNSFSSPVNQDVENFLKNNALLFSKKHQSVTYLVFEDDENASDELVGYFTLTVRQITIDCNNASKTNLKKFRKFGELSYDNLKCEAPAYLIAQLGKNFNCTSSSGKIIMDCAYEKIKEVQRQIGCGIMFLEAENHEKLLNFYQNNNNRFNIFDDRITKDGTKLIQLYRFV